MLEFKKNNTFSCSAQTGMVFDVKKFAIHDGPGIRTTIFLKGCPLSCQWCHNPESWQLQKEVGFAPSRCIGCGKCILACPNNAISFKSNVLITDTSKCDLCGVCVDVCTASARELIGKPTSVDEILRIIKRDVPFYDQSSGGVTFSGGEPLGQPDFLLQLLMGCKDMRIHTCVDTTCYAKPQILDSIMPYTDLFLCDIKHIDTDKHRLLTGVDNHLILDNIAKLAKAGKDIFVRIPIVPGFNDDDLNIEQTGKFVRSIGGINRIDILPCNPGGSEKALRLLNTHNMKQFESPTEEQMQYIAGKLMDLGFQVTIRG